MSKAIALSSEAAEVALGEAQAVLAMVQDDERRGRLADLVAAVGSGELAEDESDALAELLELGLQTGRIRAQYGPGGEQAALRLFRKLPRGQELSESAREVSGALASFVGKPLTGARIEATGGRAPLAYAFGGGTTPPGLGIDASGTLSGIPSTAGSYSFEISVTDAPGLGIREIRGLEPLAV